MIEQDLEARISQLDRDLQIVWAGGTRVLSAEELDRLIEEDIHASFVRLTNDYRWLLLFALKHWSLARAEGDQEETARWHARVAEATLQSAQWQRDVLNVSLGPGSTVH